MYVRVCVCVCVRHLGVVALVVGVVLGGGEGRGGSCVECSVEGGGWRVEGGGWRVEGGGWRVECGVCSV